MSNGNVSAEMDSVDAEELMGAKPPAALYGRSTPFESVFWRSAGTDIEMAQVTFKDKVRDFLKTRALGKSIMIINVCFSLSACVLYVAATYSSQSTQDELYFALPENFFNLWFFIDYIFYIWLAEDRIDHITSAPVICDLLSLLPALNYFFGSDLGFFRSLRAFRAFRVLRAHRVLSFYAPGALRMVARLFLIIFSCLFVAAGFCHALEQIADDVDYEECPGGGSEDCDQPFSQANMSFHESLYFVIVTFSTVGYGDIYPTHWYSRMVIALIIPCAIVIIPVAGTTIYEILASRSVYEKPYKHHSGWTHIVMCGSLEMKQLRRFLKEWYHKDMGKSNRKRVVLLKPEEPDQMSVVNRILEHPFLETRVSWIKGSVFRRECMRWVRGLPEMKHQAEAFLVTTDPHAPDKTQEDSRAIQRAIAIRRQNPSMQVIVQLLLHESKHRLYQENINIFCVEEIKYGMLGRSCFVPGLTTLLSTIFQCREYVDFQTQTLAAAKSGKLASMGDTEIEAEQRALVTGLQNKREALGWREEWLLNSIRDTAQVMLPAELSGMLFQDLAQLVFSKCGHIVIAMELPATPHHPSTRVVVNPYDFPLCAGDSFIVLSMGRHVASEFATHLAELAQTEEVQRLVARSLSQSEAKLGRSPSSTASMTARRTRATELYNKIEADSSLTQRPVPALISSNPPSFWQEGAKYSKQQVLDWGRSHIKDTLPEDVHDHIIYYGPLSSAAFFLQPLMKEDAFLSNENAYPQIVVIDSDCQDTNLFEPEMVRQWERLTFYDKLFIMQGDVIEPHSGLPWCSPSTFTRAGVHRAAKFVMPHSNESAQGENLLGDEEVIRVLRNLREHVMIHRHSNDVMRFKPLFIVELLHRHHIEYIRRPLPRPMAYASGSVVHAQFLDIFPGKMFYSSASLPLLEDLISSWDARPYVDVSDRGLGYKHIESCHVVLRDLPPHMHGKSFGEFFEHCATNYAVCIGLYRHHQEWDQKEGHAEMDKGVQDLERKREEQQREEQNADEQMLEDLRYVYVNPRRHDILSSKDKAYLLVNTLWYEHTVAEDRAPHPGPTVGIPHTLKSDDEEVGALGSPAEEAPSVELLEMHTKHKTAQV